MDCGWSGDGCTKSGVSCCTGDLCNNSYSSGVIPSISPALLISALSAIYILLTQLKNSSPKQFYTAKDPHRIFWTFIGYAIDFVTIATVLELSQVSALHCSSLLCLPSISYSPSKKITKSVSFSLESSTSQDSLGNFFSWPAFCIFCGNVFNSKIRTTKPVLARLIALSLSLCSYVQLDLVFRISTNWPFWIIHDMHDDKNQPSRGPKGI